MRMEKVVAGMVGAALAAMATALILAARPRNTPMDAETCAELAAVAGYEHVATSDGSCWLRLGYGVTLPLPQALDAIGFVFRAAETDKLARIHEVRQARASEQVSPVKARRE